MMVVYMLNINATLISMLCYLCRTALHWASKRSHKAIVANLLNHGADKTVKTINGETAADLATEQSVRCLLGGQLDLKHCTGKPWLTQMTLEMFRWKKVTAFKFLDSYSIYLTGNSNIYTKFTSNERSLKWGRPDEEGGHRWGI